MIDAHVVEATFDALVRVTACGGRLDNEVECRTGRGLRAVHEAGLRVVPAGTQTIAFLGIEDAKLVRTPLLDPPGESLLCLTPRPHGINGAQVLAAEPFPQHALAGATPPEGQDRDHDQEHEHSDGRDDDTWIQRFHVDR